MEGFILRYRNEARSRQHSSVHEASSITAHPAYIVLFLIHFLAHDANFPADACQDEEIYARFFWLEIIMTVFLCKFACVLIYKLSPFSGCSLFAIFCFNIARLSAYFQILLC